MGTPSSGATAIYRARSNQRTPSVKRNNLPLPFLAHPLSKNTKTNPAPTPAFPQAPVNIRLKKTHPLPALPNQAYKAGSRQYQATQNPDRNRIQTRLSALGSAELAISTQNSARLSSPKSGLPSRGRPRGWFGGASGALFFPYKIHNPIKHNHLSKTPRLTTNFFRACQKPPSFVIRISSLIRHSSFDFRNCFSSCAFVCLRGS